MRIQNQGNVAPKRPVAQQASAEKPAKLDCDLSVKDVLKLSAKAVGGAAGGVGAMVVGDLAFHGGNNGGDFYRGGVYGAAAFAGAALAAGHSLYKQCRPEPPAR